MTNEIFLQAFAIDEKIRAMKQRIEVLQRWINEVKEGRYEATKEGVSIRQQSFAVCLDGEILAYKQEIVELQRQFEAL